MGTGKLLLLVLLTSSYTWAQEDGSDNQNPSCLKDATKFKHLRKYLYSYEAGTSTGVTGTADSQSGSKFTCKVELEVPQPCNFILRIKQCTLREVYGVSPEGKALMKKSKNLEDFSNVLSKNEVKFSVLDGKQIRLYPQADEPLNALNIKRGIISALFSPDETQQSYSMDTVYGKCAGQISVEASKGSPATDFTVERNLKTCDQFTPSRDYVSPIALFKGLNAPLSTLIKSTQSCQYTLDQKRRHVTAVSCAENHIFLPFSHKGQYGVTAKVSQSLKLDEPPTKTNNREFSADPSMERGLAMETAYSNTKTEEGILENLLRIKELSITQQNQQRAGLFYKLVTSLRSLNNETLGPLVSRMNDLSSSITLQTLAQCGTLECFGAILQILRTGDISPVLVDAVTYSLGLLPSPCTKRVRELLNMAQHHPTRASFYALSHATSNFYENAKTITPELQDVADFMISLIGNECTGEEDKTFLSLKAIGIMGKALENTNPRIKSSLLKCVTNQQVSPDVQKAAIQALRRMTTTDEIQTALLQVFSDRQSSVQKKLAAYLMLMKNPSVEDIVRILDKMNTEDKEVRSFVRSHLINIIYSDAPQTEELGRKIGEAKQISSLPFYYGGVASSNYQFSKYVNVPGLADPLGINTEADIIFDSDYMPKEAMLETTLNVFGKSIDMFEVGVEGKGFEPTLDALFGTGGFFPDTAMRALYWADGKVPQKVTDFLYKWFDVPRDSKQSQDFQKAVLLNFEKLAKEIKSSDAPEAKAYLGILGRELGYMKLSDFKILGEMLLKSVRATQDLPGQIIRAMSKGADTDLFLHYIFLDNEFDLPTGSGLQLKVSLAGIIAPGAKAGLKFGTKNVKSELSVNPAVAVEFVTQLGVEMPDFTRHAVQMNSNLYHESGFNAQFSIKEGQVKFSIPAPKGPTKIFSFNNNLNLIYASRTEVMTSITENRKEVSSCKPLVTGLNYCLNSAYSNASTVDAAPYFPLTGQTRFEVEIQPTGEVEAYSLTANYQLKKEDRDLVDTLSFSAQAEGAKSCEAALIMRYNRNKIRFTSDVQIPNANINFGVGMNVKDESVDSRRSYSVILDFHNQQVSEATLTGQLRFDGRNEGSLGAVLSIPRLDTELSTEASVQKVERSLRLQLQSSANICSFSGSETVVFIYDDEKIEVDWKTTANSNLKKLVSKIPDINFSDLSSYPETVKDYANDILDYKVAQTDMTFRHIASHSVVATNNWFQKASRDMPFADTLRAKLSALHQLEFNLPSFPEELFLNSDGKIKYVLNKDSITIDIPLPYGGIRSDQLLSRTTLRSPPVDMPSVGLRLPSQEFRIPAFTIPEVYEMKVPLIGVLEVSSNIRSNYYNWSASYTGGNTSIDATTFSSKYEMKADSVLDILTYKIDGNALSSYDPEKMLLLSFEGSLHHMLLESNIKFNELFNFRNNDIFSGTYSYLVRSSLGVVSTFESSLKSTTNNREIITEGRASGQHSVASLFLNTDYKTTTSVDPNSVQAKTASKFTLDSPYLKMSNEMTGNVLRDTVVLTSTTDLQEGALTNTMTLDYRNDQLYLKSDTNGNYYNLVALNKFEATLSSQKAAIRSEYQADYRRHRLYTLLSASLGSLGLEVNVDATLNNMANRAAHKATLQLNREGLSTSSTTNVNYNPFTLENQVNAGFGSSGMLMKMTTNGRYREHNAKISVEGKASLTELFFNNLYEADVFAVNSKNNLNFKINKEGLRFANNLLASYDTAKLESSNELTIRGTSLQFTSKYEDFLHNEAFYKQNFELQMQPYTMDAKLSNEYKYNLLELNNRGRLQLEAFKITLDGDMRGAYSKDEIKHAYAFSMNGLASKMNTDTIANIQGVTHNHQVTLETAGLSAAFTSNSNCEAKSMRLTNKIHSSAAPFSFMLDSQTNGDGRLQVLGEHTGQLYSKLLLNAEVLSFNFAHDFRGSTRHLFETGAKHETLLDYQAKVLFTPAEQVSSWKLKSHLNKNTLTQEFRAYNNIDGIGVTASGNTFVDLSILDRQVQLPYTTFNPIDALNLRDRVSDPQEFAISGYVNYDKNKDMHVINLPFIESLPSYFEGLRHALLTYLQALQRSLKDVNIDQHIRALRSNINRIPQKINDYVNGLDLDGKIKEAKERLLVLTKEYQLTAEELQTAVENYFRMIQQQLQGYISKIDTFIQEIYSLDRVNDAVQMLIQKFVEQLKALDKEYRIREKILEVIYDLQWSIEQINMNDLAKSLESWIQNVDDVYQIKANIRKLLQEIQAQIQRIDLDQMATNVKQTLQSIELRQYVEKIRKAFPIENVRTVIEQMKNIVITMLEEYEVSEKINAVVDRLQDAVKAYDLDKKVQELIENFMQFINQQKVRETLKKIADMVNALDLKTYFNKLVAFVDEAVKKVRDYDFKKLIDDINDYLNLLIEKLKAFNYDKFVDDVNAWLREVTQTINEKMNGLELPQKAEALKQYLNDVKLTVTEYFQEFRDIKLSEILKRFQDIMRSTVLNDLRIRLLESFEDARDRMYSMDIQKECQRYLRQVSQAYWRLVTHISEQWKNAADKITKFAEENNLQDSAEKVKMFIEEGFVMPVLKIGFINIPSFEMSLRALREATFRTPYFTVPFTDLHVPSVEINFRRLQQIEIPTRFVTPEFTFFDTYRVPSYVFDLNEIKAKIVRTFDQILSSDFQWPSPEVYLKNIGMRDLTMSDMGFPTFSFPEIHIPNMQIPEIQLPKLTLKNIQLSDIQIPEFQLPKIPHTVSIPTFGKLTSVFKVTSPFFSLAGTAEVQNTTTEKNPEIIGTLSVDATSMMEALSFVLKADSRISAPLMEQLILKESVQLSNKYLRYDHNGEVTFTGSHIQSRLVTKANARSEDSLAEFQNDIIFKVQRKITAAIKTKYSHQLNIPQMNIASQVALQNDIDSSVEAGRILLTSTGKGNWKWAQPSVFTDEGTHQSDFKFNLRGPLMELSGSNKINGILLTLDQNFKYESGFLSFVNLDITSKAECPHIGNSIVTVKGTGQVSEMKLELTATHNAELTGHSTGTINNDFTFLTKPFELKLTTNNNGNLKVSFPLKLTGKIEFLNNYELLLNTNVQQASWQANGRFNQYKISHTISASNNDEKIGASVEMNGEANLDFLTIPITIPEIHVPYTAMKTPKVKEFSLWERTGLKNLLTTTKQNFDLNVKLQYKKNKDMHSFSLPLEPLYDFINTNMITVDAEFGKWRDSAVIGLSYSYNKAKAQFDKYKVQTQANKIPRTFTIPGYTIPFVNVEVSSFSAELPAFGFIIPKEIRTPSLTLPVVGFSIPTYTVVIPSLELAVLHVPDALRKINLPKFTLPKIQNSISVPALGDLTYDFSFKSNVISLTTNAGLYNQSDISARISVVSTSVIDALQFNLDGTTGLTRKRGLKLATALALKTVFMEGKHESSMSFSRRNIEASVTTNGKLNIPILKLTARHELTGNTKTKPTVSSKMSVNYEFSESKYGNDAKGSFDHTLNLEGLSSYLSLETLTKGDVTGTFMKYQAFNGKINNEANTYLNSNGFRSSVRIVGNAIADHFGTLDVTETLGLEASTSRIYAVWEHNGKNYLRYTPAFTTTGEQSMKAKIEMAFWSLLASLQLQISQPSSFFDVASLTHTINLNLYPEKQEFAFNGEGILDSLVLAHIGKLSNDASDSKFEIGGSLEGHADFLKTVILPIYEKSVWDVLKFDLTTSPDKKQYLKASTSVTYTKNKDGFFFAIPVNKLSDGFVITFPALTLKTPEWIKSLPNTVSNMEVPDMPTELNIPTFQVPFTNLNVPAYKIDLRNIKINKKMSTIPFDLSLPSMPKVKFPKVDITTKYITIEEYKIPFFEVTIPQYQITLARYTLPKSFYGLDFNSLANKIAEIDLPTIEIPEQNIEFPPVKMNLPAGLFIPAFGSLAGTVQIASPIYNLTWTSKLANESGSLVASTDATSSSTLRFLEFDLDASGTNSLSGNTLNHNGKGTFSHPDLSIEWQQDFSFNCLRLPVHHIVVDIKSPTFTDVQIRCQHENNKLSSSVNIPTVGTLGILVEKDDTVIKGKLYSRPSSSSGKDNLILKGEMSLKNPEKIQNKINWREDTVADLLNGLKGRLPRMSDSVYNCVNKYHNEHFGMDISDARLKMKEHMQSKVSSAYRSTANHIDNMENSLQYASDFMKSGWHQADMSVVRNYDDMKAKLYDNSIVILRKYKDTAKELIDAIIEFVKMTRFQLPGQTQRYTGEELLSMAMTKATSSLDLYYQRIQQWFDAVIQSINNAKYNIPGTDVTIEGTKILSSIKTFLQELNKVAKKVLSDMQNISLEKMLNQLKAFIQEVSQKSEKLIEAVRLRDYQDVKAQAQQMYRDAANSQYARDLSNLAERIKKVLNELQIIFQSVYEELSDKLQQLMVYGKALREEYLDPNIVGWSVKYYEIEEKIITLVKSIIESLRELPGKYGIDVSEAVEKVKEYLAEYYQNAGNAMVYAQDQTRQVLKEFTTSLGDKITDLSFTARKVSAELHHILLRKLQEGYDQLSRSYEKLIAETGRLVDLVIEKYNSVVEFIMQLLENFQKTASDQVKTYVSTRKGEIKFDVPHPFTWKSFDEVPELRDEILSKQMEIARSMVSDGIDKGSKKWEELQLFIEQQLKDGKLSVQQIIENIRNWKNN